MALFGFLGYVFAKLECEPAPMLLGHDPGPDDGGVPPARHAPLPGRSDVFLRRPISCVVLLVAVIALATAVLPAIRAKREEAFKE